MGNKLTTDKSYDKIENIEDVDMSNMKLPSLLHIIASNYIIKSTFQDLENLHNPEFCNKLIILTSDVLEKHLNNLEITFMDKTINNNNKLINKPVIYFNKTDLENLNKNDNLKTHKCKGIAKFYVKIAHLFAAINKTINPLFTYKNEKGEYKTIDLLDKNMTDAPKASLSKLNYCSRRIAALKIEKDKLIVPNKHCNLNEVVNIQKGGFLHKDNNSFIGNLFNFNTNQKNNSENDGGEKIIKTDLYKDNNIENTDSKKSLYDNIGIPELEKLYYDVYDHDKNTFSSMSEESKKQYDIDLETFFKTFYNKEIPINKETNEKIIKKFSDIKLENYNITEICKNNKNKYNSIIRIEDNELFTNYALHIKNMISRNKQNELKLMNILNQLFTIRNDKENNKNYVSINIQLNNNNLNELIKTTRSIILKLYVDCEKDFQKGLDILETIILYKMKKTGDNRLNKLKKEKNELLDVNNEHIKNEFKKDDFKDEINKKTPIDINESKNEKDGKSIAELSVESISDAVNSDFFKNNKKKVEYSYKDLEDKFKKGINDSIDKIKQMIVSFDDLFNNNEEKDEDEEKENEDKENKD